MTNHRLHSQILKESSPSRRHIGTLKSALDPCCSEGYIPCVLCSPLDQPKGLRRGFAFRGVRCH